MPSRTISLSEEAYRKLKGEKRKGESFSAVIKRLTRKRPLTSFAGAWKDLGKEEVEEIKDILRKGRELSIRKTSWME
jgi:predicted CopG family antitoxin